MYLCICKSVSDHQIRQAVDQGACGFGDLSVRFGVGIECGKCIDSINQFLQECLATPISMPALTEAVPMPVPATVAPVSAPVEPVPARPWFAIDV